MPLRIDVLGPLVARDGDRELAVGAGRQRALLALLAIHGGETVSVDRLVDELWEGSPPPTAQKVLQGYVSQLRRVLPDGAIVTHGSAYELRADTDAAELERAVERAATLPPAAAASALREALALVRGEPYGEFAYEAWAQTESRRLAELHLAALEERIDADLALGGGPQLVAELEALVAQHPLRERLRAQLMLALYRAGRQADALGVFAAGRRALVDGLGLEPGSELQELQRRILEQDPELGAGRRSRAPADARRGRRLVALGAVVAVAAVAIAVAETRASSAPLHADALAFLDWNDARAQAQVALGAPQTSVAVGGGAIWTLDGDTGTVTSIDERTHHVLATFSVGQRPIDIAYGAGAFWVLNGGFQPAAGGKGTPIAPTVTRFDAITHTAAASITVPGVEPGVGFYYFHHQAGQHEIAYGAGSVWFATASPFSGTVYRIDAQSDRIVGHVRGVDAGSLVFADGSLWTENLDVFPHVEIDRIDPATNRVVQRVTAPVLGASSFAVGGGALWVPDFYTGTVYKVLAGPPVVAHPIAASVGVGAIAFANGSVWAGNEADGTLRKIDARTGTVVRTLRLPPPRALAATPHALLVTTGAVAGETLPATSCGPVEYGGRGSPRFLIAADLDFRGVPDASFAMSDAVVSVLRSRGFRAGRFTIGYQACDDSSGISGVFDPGKCIANAGLYAKTPKLLGVVGTYDSGCAADELPVLNGAAVPVASPTNTYDVLTRRTPGEPQDMLAHLYPTGVRNYVRVIAPDAVEVAADAELLHGEGARRVAILDDGEQGATPSHIAWFEYSARKLGIATSIVRTASVGELVRQLRRTHAQGLFVAKELPFDPRQAYPALRRAFGERWPIVGTDFLAPTPFDARVFITAAGLPDAQLPAAGRRLVARVRKGGSLSAAYAGAAAEVLLGAIARSDGTRRSVLRELFATNVHDGPVGDLRFTTGGDPVTAPVSFFHPSPVQGDDAYFRHLRFVRAITPPPSIIHP
jgi:DNA-binding SARP family transcriptional activator